MSDTFFARGKLPMDYLQGLLSRYTDADARLVAGPRVGEDVAVIDMGDRYMVVKTDPVTFATDQIGWYVVNVNANDIATSGARPLWMLATLLLPEDRSTPKLVESIFGQIHAACQQLGIVLVGGHTEVTWGLTRPIVVGVMMGEVAKERLITTAGARVGDRVLLVQGVPIEGTAILAREKADDLRARGYDEGFIARAQGYLHDPGISVLAAAHVAAEHPGVTSMHDPTEGGLATALHELAHASGAGLELRVDAVPILPEGAQLCAEYGLDPLGVIASGALIVTVRSECMAGLLRAYEQAGIPCAWVGDLLEREAGVYAVRAGERVPLPRYDSDEIARVL